MVAIAGESELHSELDDRPDCVEIGKMNQFGVYVAREVPFERAADKKAGDNKKEGNAEGAGKFDKVSQPHVGGTSHFLRTQRNVHLGDHDDGQTFYVIDPLDTVRRLILHILGHCFLPYARITAKLSQNGTILCNGGTRPMLHLLLSRKGAMQDCDLAGRSLETDHAANVSGALSRGAQIFQPFVTRAF